MKLQAFTVYDVKAESYTRPFFEQSTATAVRAFTDAVNEEGQDFNRHAEDYTLFHVGDFDDQTGTFTPLEPRSLGNALTFLDSSVGPKAVSA